MRFSAIQAFIAALTLFSVAEAASCKAAADCGACGAGKEAQCVFGNCKCATKLGAIPPAPGGPQGDKLGGGGGPK